MSLEKRFLDNLLQTGILPAGSRVLVAVSGGADSVALLHLLVAASEHSELQLMVGHLDHGLRDESPEDAAFVRQISESLSLPVCLERIDVRVFAQEQRLGLEEAGRQVRREFLTRVAAEHDVDRVALGHHSDDQAETFLMRLLRGSGPVGLASMRTVSGRFVRPMLSFSRREIVGFLKDRGLLWREDQSNQDLAFTRNRIRHELLPQLQQFNPNIAERLTALCEVLAHEEDYWDAVTDEALQRCSIAGEDGVHLSRKQLVGLPPALASRVIRKALDTVRGDLRRISAVHIAEVQSLVRSDAPQGEVDLPGGWVGRRYESLWVRSDRPPVPEAVRLVIAAPGEYPLPDGRCLVVSCHNEASVETGGCVEFDAASVPFPLLLRSCQPGDRLQPAGMNGTKKLQDLFVDAKLTREQRTAQLVLLSGQTVLWVVGMRRCGGARPGTSGGQILRLSLQAEK